MVRPIPDLGVEAFDAVMVTRRSRSIWAVVGPSVALGSNVCGHRPRAAIRSDRAVPAREAVPAPRLSPSSRWRREISLRQLLRPSRRRPGVEIRRAVTHDASETMKVGSGTSASIGLERAGGKPEKIRCPPRV